MRDAKMLQRHHSFGLFLLHSDLELACTDLEEQLFFIPWVFARPFQRTHARTLEVASRTISVLVMVRSSSLQAAWSLKAGIRFPCHAAQHERSTKRFSQPRQGRVGSLLEASFAVQPFILVLVDFPHVAQAEQ